MLRSTPSSPPSWSTSRSGKRSLQLWRRGQRSESSDSKIWPWRWLQAIDGLVAYRTIVNLNDAGVCMQCNKHFVGCMHVSEHVTYCCSSGGREAAQRCIQGGGARQKNSDLMIILWPSAYASSTHIHVQVMWPWKSSKRITLSSIHEIKVRIQWIFWVTFFSWRVELSSCKLWLVCRQP